MRISSDQQYQRLQDNIAAAQSRMAGLEVQLSSGKRIQRPSDDPFAMLGAMTFRSAKGLAQLHRSNAQAGAANMKTAENALQSMGDFINRAHTLALAGANGSTDQQGRNAMASEVKQLQDQLLAAANTQDASGHYIFAGFKSTTKPFEINPTPPPPLTYQGDNGQQFVDIGPGTAVPTNVLVNTTVQNAYAALEDTRTRLAAGDASGLSGVSLQLLETATDELHQARGDVGVNIQRFDDASQIALRRSDDFTNYISDREDADISEVAVKLQAAQTTYQSALAAFQATHQTSLLDFLRG